jgi:ankyrin repeat protein
MGHYDIALFLLQNGADVNISDVDKKLSLYVASSSGHYTIVRLLIAHGALSAGNAKSQFKTISKRTNGNEIFSDSNALLNPCGYPEEKISHSKEKQEEEKEGIYVAKVQEGKEETVFTREQEEKEEIIYTRETKENDEIIDRRKEQIEKGELVNTRKGEEQLVEVDDLSSFSVSCGGDALLPDDGNTSPLSIAVQKGYFDIVKYIIENSTDFDLSGTGKSPLFLAAEKGYPDILDLLLHSKYNDITKTYLGTTPLEIAVWRNETKVVQLLIQEENKLQKYLGNYHLLQILTDLKRSEFCINEKTGKEDCHANDRNHRHLPSPLWHIITDDNNDYLIHLLKIGLDINKCDYNDNTLLYKILNRTRSTHVDKFKSLMEHFEDVNVERNKWTLFLEMNKRKIHCGKCSIVGIMKYFVTFDSETWSELRKHIRRHSI